MHLILFRLSFYSKMKEITKETSFEGVEALKKAVTTELKGILKESFQQCIDA